MNIEIFVNLFTKLNLLVFQSKCLYKLHYIKSLADLFSFTKGIVKAKLHLVFMNGPSKICGRQPLNNLKGYGLLKADHILSKFLKVVFHKFYLVHSVCHLLCSVGYSCCRPITLRKNYWNWNLPQYFSVSLFVFITYNLYFLRYIQFNLFIYV